MPLKGNVHYAVRTTKSGKRVRLAFRGGSRKSRTGTVVEAKNIDTGKIHTETEFKRERKRKRRKRQHLVRRTGRRIKAVVRRLIR